MTLHTVLTCVLTFYHNHELCLDPRTNKFNNSTSVNVNVGKSSYSFNGLIVKKSAVVDDRSILFSEKVITKVTNSLFTKRGGINGILEPLTNVFKIDQ